MKEEPDIPDMTKYPYRGIYSEIAREEGVSRQWVRMAVEKHRNPRYLGLVAEKIAERQALIKKFNDSYR